MREEQIDVKLRSSPLGHKESKIRHTQINPNAFTAKLEVLKHESKSYNISLRHKTCLSYNANRCDKFSELSRRMLSGKRNNMNQSKANPNYHREPSA